MSFYDSDFYDAPSRAKKPGPDTNTPGAYESPTGGGCKVPITVNAEIMNIDGSSGETPKTYRIYWKDVIRTDDIQTAWDRELKKPAERRNKNELMRLAWTREREFRLAKGMWHAMHVQKQLGKSASPHLLWFYGSFMHDGLFDGPMPNGSYDSPSLDKDPKHKEVYAEWKKKCRKFWNRRPLDGENMFTSVWESADMTLGDYLRKTALGSDRSGSNMIERGEAKNIIFQITHGIHALQSRANGRHLKISPKSIFMIAPTAYDPEKNKRVGITEMHSYKYGATNKNAARRYIAVASDFAFSNARREVEMRRAGILSHRVAIDEYVDRGEYRVGTAEEFDNVIKGAEFSLEKAGVHDITTDERDNPLVAHDPAFEPHTEASIYGPVSELFAIYKDDWMSFRRDWGDDMFSLGLVALEVMVTGMELTRDELENFPYHHFGRARRYAPGGRNDKIKSLLDFTFIADGDRDLQERYDELVTQLNRKNRIVRPRYTYYGKQLVNICLLQKALGNPMIPEPEDWPLTDGSTIEESLTYAELEKNKDRLHKMDITMSGFHFWKNVVGYIRETHGNDAVLFLRKMLHWNSETRDTSEVWGENLVPGMKDTNKGKHFGALYPLFHPYLAASEEEKALGAAEDATKKLLGPWISGKGDKEGRVASYGWSTATASINPLPSFPALHRVNNNEYAYKNTFARNALQDTRVASYSLKKESIVESKDLFRKVESLESGDTAYPNPQFINVE